jgi:hypothetical protein
MIRESRRMRWLISSGLLGLALACGGHNSPAPTQPTVTTPAVTVSSVQVGVAGNVPATLAPGDKLQLFAQALNSDGSTSDVTNVALWQSSNPVVATVGSGGVLTAAAEGALDVSATYQTRSGSLHAEVRQSGCRLALSPASLTFGAFRAVGAVQVTATPSDCRWTVRSDASWLPLNFDPGKSGNGSFDYLVPANSTPDTRTANLVVSIAGGPSLTHVVRQERPLGCSYVVTPEKLKFPASGGTGAFDVVTTPADCRWTVSNSAAGFDLFPVRLTSPSTGQGAGRVTYTVPPNPTTFEETVVIEIRGLSGLNPPGVHTLIAARK